jgi:phosphatidyl-myo-inositol alpha-mannosyltransferase
VKIALVSPYDFPYPGGVTEHVQHLKGQFERRGHVVKILAPSSLDIDDVENGIYKVGGILPFPASGSVVRVTLSPRSYRRVKAILAYERFDVIHCHEPLMPLLPLVVLRHSKSANIGTFHAYRETQPGYYYGKPLLKRVMGRIHGRICVSEAAWQLISAYFPGEYRIIPNGIDLEEFGAAGIEPLPQFCDGKPNVLYVGRMEERKGFRYLLGAFAAVKLQFPDARLIVAGGYTEDDIQPFRRQIAERGIRDVVFAGRISEEDKPRYYRSCDVFCAPSTGFESQGIVLLEAMASGRALVASQIAGYSTVVKNGQEGLLVPPRDEAALAGALVRLLAAPDLRAQMGARGIQRAQRFAWQRVAGEILEYYDEVLRRVGRRKHLREVLHAR